MPLIELVLVLVVVGVVLWLINKYIPMQSTMKKILNAVVIIVVILWLLNAFGIMEGLESVDILEQIKQCQIALVDLTEYKKVEEVLKKSSEKLKSLNATKDKFFSIVAHANH